MPVSRLSRLAAAVFALAAATAAAAPLGLDPTFGDAGKVYGKLGGAPAIDEAAAIVTIPTTSATLVAGSCHTGAGMDFCLVRYTFEGAIDTTFGRGGVAVAAIGTGDDIARAVTLDGAKIVVAGSCTQGAETDFCVARFNANGTLDTSFNGTGKVITAVTALADQAYAVAMDGAKVVVAGDCEVPGFTDLCIVRYDSDGALDATFNLNGKLVTSLGPFDSFRAVAVSGGKVTVAGVCGLGACVARFNADGSPDTTLAGTGVAGIGALPVYQVNAMAIGDLGRITLAGTCFEYVTFTRDFCVFRFEANGQPELGLDGTGYKMFPVGDGDDDAKAVAFFGNRTVVAGDCMSGGQRRFCVAMLASWGAFDPNFNLGAPKIESFGLSQPATLAAARVHQDLLITLAGSCGAPWARDFCLVRLEQGAGRDPNFNGGIPRIDDLGLGDAFEQSRTLVRQPDGRYLATATCIGFRYVDSVQETAEENCIGRFNADGSPDTTFGTGGSVILRHASGLAYYATAALDATGRIYVAGACGASSVAFCITRLTAAGAIDTGFGLLGTAEVAMGGAAQAVSVVGVFPTADGGVVVAGGCHPGNGAESFCLLKLQSGGAVDPAFGVNGRVQPGSYAPAKAAAWDGAGYVIVGACNNSGSRFCAMRYTAAGQPDPAWNFGNRVEILVPGFLGSAGAVLATGGKVVIGGECYFDGGDSEFCLARLNGADGTLDTSFSGDGLLVVAGGIVGQPDGIRALAADGTAILAGGTCADASGRLEVCLARILSDGSPDTAFNDTGRYHAALGSGWAVTAAMLRDGNRIVAASDCADPARNTNDLCLTAYVLLPNDVPRAPTAVSAQAGDGQATVSFSPPADDGGHPVTSYTATCGGESASGAASPLVVAGLANGVQVTCQVTATNVVGTSPPSEPPVAVTPRKVPTVTVASSLNPSETGNYVYLTATVAGTSPTGDVEFRSGGVVMPQCGTIALTAGVATCYTNALPAGVTEITAHYLGDAANTPAQSAPFAQTVIANAVQLGIARGGLGQGTITSIPAGIDCGADCLENYPAGTVVTLVFTPVNGSTVQWVLNCDTPSGNTCVVTLGADRTVHAAVSPDPLDLDGDGIPNDVETAEGRDPDVRDNDVFGNARLFAMQQYRDFLGREGDAAGIQGWADAVTSGAWTRLQVIDAFLQSQEFAGFVAPVVRLYFATFLRVPDYNGLTFNAGLVRNGTVTAAQLADFFVAGPEFTATYGSLDNAQFVTLLYQNVLGRAPDAAGLAGWAALLDGGTYTRGQVLLGFSESAEYQAAMANEVFVTMMYAGMLRRTPEPAGFSGWVSFLDNATYSREQVINGFYLSAEYRRRFLD
jgi:uncharacterized delta-60 repeat protein